MTKRLLALVLVCILAIPILAFPASAAEFTIVNGNYANDTGNIEFDNFINIYNITNLLGILIDDVLTDIVNHVASIRSFVSNIEDILNAWVTSWADTMSTMFDSIELMIGWQEIQTEAQNSILEWNELIWTALDTINTNFITFAKAMETAHNNILDSLNAFWGHFIDYWEDISNQFSTYRNNWNTKIEEFKSKVSSGFTSLQQLLTLVNQNILRLSQGSTTDQEKADEYDNQVSTESTEFQDNMDAIDEWTRPDYESDFDPSVEGIAGADIAEYTDAISVLWMSSFEVFTMVIFMAFAFSTISFVVFGKR